LLLGWHTLFDSLGLMSTDPCYDVSFFSSLFAVFMLFLGQQNCSFSSGLVSLLTEKLC
jgi:hypothetical protein